MKTRVVLIGDLIPSSDKWSRIIEGGGGTSVHTKSTITQAVREFVKGETEGMRVAVVPENMKKNKLIQFLLDHHFVCVPSAYVMI